MRRKVLLAARLSPAPCAAHFMHLLESSGLVSWVGDTRQENSCQHVPQPVMLGCRVSVQMQPTQVCGTGDSVTRNDIAVGDIIFQNDDQILLML